MEGRPPCRQLNLPPLNTDESPLPDRTKPAHLLAEEHHNRAIIYFVTVCTKDRRQVLASDAVHAVLLGAWREATWFAVGRYAIMPDHVHLFCTPAVWPPESLARWVSCWKSLAARRWPTADGTKLWQRDFWDRQLRSGDSYSDKWNYVKNNPVRAGLVDRGEAWKYQGEVEVLRWHE